MEVNVRVNRGASRKLSVWTFYTSACQNIHTNLILLHLSLPLPITILLVWMPHRILACLFSLGVSPTCTLLPRLCCSRCALSASILHPCLFSTQPVWVWISAFDHLHQDQCTSPLSHPASPHPGVFARCCTAVSGLITADSKKHMARSHNNITT